MGRGVCSLCTSARRGGALPQSAADASSARRITAFACHAGTHTVALTCHTAAPTVQGGTILSMAFSPQGVCWLGCAKLVQSTTCVCANIFRKIKTLYSKNWFFKFVTSVFLYGYANKLHPNC